MDEDYCTSIIELFLNGLEALITKVLPIIGSKHAHAISLQLIQRISNLSQTTLSIAETWAQPQKTQMRWVRFHEFSVPLIVPSRQRSGTVSVWDDFGSWGR